MARYDYQCKTCEHVFEVQHPITEEPKINCEKCKKACKRLISGQRYMYGTVGVDWNTDPSKASASQRAKAQAAKKRKVQF